MLKNFLVSKETFNNLPSYGHIWFLLIVMALFEDPLSLLSLFSVAFETIVDFFSRLVFRSMA